MSSCNYLLVAMARKIKHNQMSRREKLRARLFTKPYPKDFRFDDLVTVMRGFEFNLHETKGGSSHKYFLRVLDDGEEQIIYTSRPHPSGILKEYQIKELHKYLSDWGYL